MLEEYIDMLSRPKRTGMGDVLYESADIAYNTDTRRFFNPKTGADLGINPPAGGWPIDWYIDSKTNQVTVPYGTGTTHATASEAASHKTSVEAQLQEHATQGNNATQVNSNVATTVDHADNSPLGLNINTGVLTSTIFGVPVWVLGAGALLFLLKGRR